MKYGDKVRMKGGFYIGQEGTLQSLIPFKEGRNDYLVKLKDGNLTDYIAECYLELIK